MTKGKWIGLVIGLFAVAVILAFFVTSIVLADLHELSLVAEWQSWFGIAKPPVETPPVEEIVETAKVVVLKPIQALIAC